MNPPTDLSIRDFKADRALGRSSLIGQLAETAATAICGLYGKNPSSLVRIIPFGSGSIDNSRGIFDDLCENIAPLPPPPAPPFSGGQCLVNYNVTVTLGYHTGTGANRQEFTGVSTTLCTGDILSIFKNDVGAAVSSGDPSGRLVQILAFCKGSNNPVSFPAPSGYQSALLGGSQPFAYTSHSVSVVRADGQQDNCGSLPPAYPPVPPLTVPDLDSTSIINIAPNTTVTVPVRIVPTFAPITNIFRPEFNVDVGGVNVNISAGGFTFSPTVQIAPNVNLPTGDPRTNPPPAIPITPPSQSGSPVDLTPVLTLLDEVKDEVIECCDRNHPFAALPVDRIISTSLGSGNSGIIQVPPKTFRVVTTITSPLSEINTQGGDNSPSIYYAGWAWFEVDGGMSMRYPIDAAVKSFEPPARSTGKFAYKLQKNYTMSVIAHSSNK